VSGKGVEDYVSDAGGTLRTADRKRVFWCCPTARHSRCAAATGAGRGTVVVPPGSTIIVPKNIDPLFTLNVIRDITAVVSQIATSLGTVALLATR
jgi:hypothetical protein